MLCFYQTNRRHTQFGVFDIFVGRISAISGTTRPGLLKSLFKTLKFIRQKMIRWFMTNNPPRQSSPNSSPSIIMGAKDPSCFSITFNYIFPVPARALWRIWSGVDQRPHYSIIGFPSIPLWFLLNHCALISRNSIELFLVRVALRSLTM